MTSSLGVGDIVLTWNGTACDEAVTNGSATNTRVVTDFDFSGCVYDPKLTPFPMRDGAVKDGASTTADHEGIFWIRSTVSGIATLERALVDEWRLLGNRYNPYDGVVSLQVARKDQGGSPITSVLKAEVIEAPCAFFVTGGGPKAPGMRPQGHLVYPVKFRAAAPFWQAAADSTSTLFSISGSADTDTITNSGVKPCGGKITISNVSGNLTKITVTNSTTGKTFAITTAGTTFTNGDYVDWFYTSINDDPTWVGASALTISPNDAELEFARGANSMSIIRTTGTGTCDLTIVTKRLDFSF